MNKTKISAGVALAAAVGLSSAATAGGIPFPSWTGASPAGIGFVAVDDTASLTQTGPNQYQFSILTGTTNNGVLNTGTNTFAVSNEAIDITANLKKVGSTWDVVSGSYSITGNISACSSGCGGGLTWTAGSGNLFSANFASGAVGASTSSETLGFTTTASSFSGWAVTNGLASTLSSPESVYLFASASGTPASLNTTANSAWNSLVAALAGGGTLSSASYSSIGSYATVPLPLPAALLVSGLMGLGGMFRRKSAVPA